MRATSIIYKRELGRYLRSPIGWIIAAAAEAALDELYATIETAPLRAAVRSSVERSA